MNHYLQINKYDFIVVGGGHAGCEAAIATAKMGLKTLLISSNLDRIGHTSCNPAIGGLAKSHMVFEIDALGGSMGLWADKAAIQVRKLNASKGPAVQATRAQIDRIAYRYAVQKDLFQQENLFFAQGMVEELLCEKDQIKGVKTQMGQKFKSDNVLLTTGTFTGAYIHVGDLKYPGGRVGDESSLALTKSLGNLGIKTQRFMTCTPPRILSDSVNYTKLEKQSGDTPTPRFSTRGYGPQLPQVPCYLTWTNEETHEIIRKNVNKSSIYNGSIKDSAGPRYCPSIEDKIVRYPDKLRHQVFVEPEGHQSKEIFPAAIFTALPYAVQLELMQSIPGFEKAHITQPGYAVEYDIVIPTQLSPTLELKNLSGLWTAGQINGTSGYEEAAAQGIWAALNVYSKTNKVSPFIPGRDKSYISVLVDDLVTLGTDEPYRMFTSRSEYRLLLRETNAQERLTRIGREFGLVKNEQWEKFLKYSDELKNFIQFLGDTKYKPDALLQDFCNGKGENVPSNTVSLEDLLKRPSLDCSDLIELEPKISEYSDEVQKEAETIIRYSGYVTRQKEMAERMAKNEQEPLPSNLDYTQIAGLSLEAIDKLTKLRPTNLGQAGRITGITPAAISALEIYLAKLRRKNKG